LNFTNTKKGCLVITKVDSVTREPLSGVKFKIQGCNGNPYPEGDYTTDSSGVIRLDHLPSGDYTVAEVQAKDGYRLDDTVKTINIEAGKTKEITFENTPLGGLLIRKMDASTKEPISGVKFKITAANGELIPDNEGLTSSNGIYTTDENGQIYLQKLNPNTYVVTEVETIDGYLLNAAPQTVVVSEADTQVLTFTNMPLGGLLVKKMDSATKEPLADVIFKITRTDGTVVGNSNGEFRTDERGFISLPGLEPGSYIVREVQAKPGYLLDDTPHAVEVKDHQTYTLEVFNQPLGNLIINKLSSVDNTPLEGVKFQIKYANGQVVDNKNGQVSSNGIYYTDRNGQIILSGVVGAVVVTELETVPGYRIDPNTRTQTVVINPNDTQTINFYNTPTTTLIIRKFVEGTENEPLSGVAFRVVDGAGAAVGPDDGLYYTDKSGEIVLTGIDPGTTVIAREVKTVDGFVLDGPPQDIKIEAGHVQQLTFWNKRAGTLVIQKKDSVTGALIAGAQFQVTYANGGYVDNDNGHLSSNGLYTTDDKGEIRINGITGTVVVKETKPAPGYVIDQSTQTQTVTVNPEDTQSLVFLNEPLCSLTLKKLDSVTGKPIPNTEFTVKDGNGNVLGRYTTGKDGTVTVSGLVPGSTVVVSESKVPSGYVLNTTPQTIIVKNGSNTLSIGGTGTVGGNNGGTGVDGGTGDGNNLVFENDPKTRLVIEKYITGTTTPLQGVTFLVTESNGQVVGSSNGEFVTDENGRIVIEGLEPGVTIIAKEIRTLEGYVLDTTPKSIKIEVGDAQTLRFFNAKQGTIVIRKLDKQTNEPLAGVEFQITYSDGSYLDDDYGHLSSKGLYKTDANGEIRISGVVGTLVITETKPLPGYVMDEGTKTQTVRVNAADTQTITVYNTKVGGLTIIKKDEETGARIKGVEFEVRKLNGEIIGTYTTDARGVISLPQVEKGWYQIEVKDGGTATLEITNRQSGSALIHKIDSVTGKGIYGVKFLLSDAKGNPVGTYESDNEGYVYIDKELADGRYTIREIECADGYILDTQPKTIYVEYGGCTTITWTNTAVTGQIQITKTSADYNSMNGWPAGTLIPGTVFEIYHYRTGNLVDTIRTDKNGVAATKALPLGRYTLIESKAADYYALDKTPIVVDLEFGSQIVRVAVSNKSLYTNVSIEKTGYVEVMPGQAIRYTFSGIANNSNVRLDNFYWRDTLPAQVRLNTIVTGTYNFPGVYKITYRVNGGEYRTLADNLSTSKNYTLQASPAALGLAANERVTEIMFVFGQAPAGFAQVEKPQIKCTSIAGLTAGSSFVNIADVGGTYNGVWVQAISRWVTTVYGKPTPLPKTGY